MTRGNLLGGILVETFCCRGDFCVERFYFKAQKIVHVVIASFHMPQKKKQHIAFWFLSQSKSKVVVGQGRLGVAECTSCLVGHQLP